MNPHTVNQSNAPVTPSKVFSLTQGIMVKLDQLRTLLTPIIQNLPEKAQPLSNGTALESELAIIDGKVSSLLDSISL